MSSESTFVTKVTLSTKKVVLLREPKISDQDLAAQAASRTVKGDNVVGLTLAMQKELLKQLVVKIDDKQPRPSELESLDSWFSLREYMELSSVVAKIAGLGDVSGNEPMTEQVKFGAL